ncbi:hypothetical protein KP509_06G026200 [Ceratopteris richardii]|uniref:3-oxo-5-alpha-steroid 4-dehydrogenase C-terminal domain-containing protein n=1 Tax=Ceratopteris richardii TaxID=49495 RepID=A0A8T2UIV4_CERRI|nr:hypothetical protein KP509_06G026200 [Ceratopteris richardii]
MLVTVTSRSRKEVVKGGIQLSENATVKDLKASIHKRTGNLYPERQRLSLPLVSGQTRPTVLDGDKRLCDVFPEGSDYIVILKDLGPRFVGLPEKRVIYPVQTYATIYWCFYYFKRIMETFFVRKFSHATSPLSFVFRNCCYYWSFAVFIAYFVNHPYYTHVGETQRYIGFGLGIICQLANFYYHIILKNLRDPKGQGGYQIPRGFLFNYITCANYTTEIYQGLGFNIATQTVAGYSFLVVVAYIMLDWAAFRCLVQKVVFFRRIERGRSTEGKGSVARKFSILYQFLRNRMQRDTRREG